MAMFVLLLLASLGVRSCPSEARLYNNYYGKTCRSFNKIIQDTITNKQITNPTAAALCLFLHDCFVTIGFLHCKEFSSGIYNYSRNFQRERGKSKNQNGGQSPNTITIN